MKNHKPVTIIFVCLFLIISFSCKKNTEYQGAILTNLTGKIEITKVGAKSFILKKEDLMTQKAFVKADDTVTTSKNSSVDIQFSSGISMRLGSNSNLKIQESTINSKNNTSKIEVALDQGKLMVKTEKQSSDSDIKIQSPTLIAAVRGTEFLVNADKNILVSEGSVEVKKPEIEGQEEEEEGIVIEEGNKGETDGEGIDVSPLDDEDKEELNAMNEGLEFINEETRAQMEKIISTFEAEKGRITQDFEQQVDKNLETMAEEKERQQETFQNEKSRITGEGGAKSELERIKSGQ